MRRDDGRRRCVRWAAAAGLALAAAGGLGGCASYANVPGPDRSVALRDPNERNAREVMAVAVRTVVDRHPAGRPGQAFAVGLPVGMNEKSAGEVLMSVGPEAVRAPAAGLPTYYIGRVWIRSGFAKVDVLRPVVELGRGADGQYPYQLLTVWQEGGLEPWKPTRLQRWGVGSYPRDALYFIPPELLGTMEPAGDAIGGPEPTGGSGPGAALPDAGTRADRAPTDRAEDSGETRMIRVPIARPAPAERSLTSVPEAAVAEPNPYRRELPPARVDSGRMLDAVPAEGPALAAPPARATLSSREPAEFDPFNVSDDGAGLPPLPPPSVRESTQAVVVEPL